MRRADRQSAVNLASAWQVWLFVLLLGLLLSPISQATEPQKKASAFVVGIAPHTSVRTLFASYQPLRQFLQQSLQREVRIVSAPNFADFLQRALDGRYDMVITTGHQARLLQTDAGWMPLVTYQATFRCALVSANERVMDVSALQGKRLFTLGPGSLTALWSMAFLAERGIVPSEIVALSASDSVVERLLDDKAAAASLSLANLDRLEPGTRAKLHVLQQSEDFLGRTYMLNPRLASEREVLRAALWAFAQTSEAQAYFKSTGLGGYREVPLAELEAMDRYAQALRIPSQKSSVNMLPITQGTSDVHE